MNEKLVRANAKLDAAQRALAIVNTLKPGPFKTKHRSRVFGSLNRIRAEVRRAR